MRNGTSSVSPPWELVEGGGSVVATAIHAGHELRPEVAALVALSAADRRREEDPHTDSLTAPFSTRLTVNRSRFEVDLNRSREGAVYVDPEQSWGLAVWKQPPPPDLMARSLAIHDEFYRSMTELLDGLAHVGPFVVLDLHSYNHRRNGPEHPPAPAAENPDLNLGTASVETPRWRPVIDRFTKELLAGMPATTTFGENVRFEGGFFARWVNERYRGIGCALALEIKKTFMDEWTDEVDQERLGMLVGALAGTIPGLSRELGEPG